MPIGIHIEWVQMGIPVRRYVHSDIFIYTPIYICICMCIHIYIHICTYVYCSSICSLYVYTYIHIYICIYIYMNSARFLREPQVQAVPEAASDSGKSEGTAGR